MKSGETAHDRIDGLQILLGLADMSTGALLITLLLMPVMIERQVRLPARRLSAPWQDGMNIAYRSLAHPRPARAMLRRLRARAFAEASASRELAPTRADKTRSRSIARARWAARQPADSNGLQDLAHGVRARRLSLRSTRPRACSPRDRFVGL
jgi:hypothetical protein